MEKFHRTACDDCGKRFSTKRSMCMHRAKAHPVTESNAEAEAAAQPEPVSKKGSVCALCNKCCPNKTSLSAHMRSAHKSVSSVAGKNTSVETLGHHALSCNKCGKRFYTAASLKMHKVQLHSKEVIENEAFTDDHEHADLSNLELQATDESRDESMRKGPVGQMHVDFGSSSEVVAEPVPERVTRSQLFHKGQPTSGNTRKQLLKQPIRKDLETLKMECAIENSSADVDPLLERLTFME